MWAKHYGRWQEFYRCKSCKYVDPLQDNFVVCPKCGERGSPEIVVGRTVSYLSLPWWLTFLEDDYSHYVEIKET